MKTPMFLHARHALASDARRFMIGFGLVLVLPFLSVAPGVAAPVRVRSELKVYGRNKVPKKVTAQIFPKDHNQGTSPSDSVRQMSRRVGCAEDEAGHAIPLVLGGPGRIGNIYPLFGKTNNDLGKWEQKLGKKLKAGECLSIDYEVQLTYGDRKLQLRPTKIEIDATCHRPDGVAEKIPTKRVTNDKPSRCETKVFPEE